MMTISDALASYEKGLEEFRQRLGEQHGQLLDFLNYEHQLRTNIQQARCDGDTSNLSAARSRIIRQLNELALKTVRISFNDLCFGALTQHTLSDKVTLGELLEQAEDGDPQAIALLQSFQAQLAETFQSLRFQWAEELQSSIGKALAPVLQQLAQVAVEVASSLNWEMPLIELPARSRLRFPSTPLPVRDSSFQEILERLRRVEGKLDVLRDDLSFLRQALLARYEANEQGSVAGHVERLNLVQLTALRTILDALEAGRMSDAEVSRALDAVQQTLDALPQRIADLIERQAVTDAINNAVDMKHKLKLALPIIPVLLSYEGEIELSSEMTLLKGTWRKLRTIPNSYKRFLLISNIIAVILGVAAILLAKAWHMDAFARLITAGVFFLAVEAIFWVGPRLVHVPVPRSFSRMRVKVVSGVVNGVLLLGLLVTWFAVIWTEVDWNTFRCRNAQVSSCLELDLVTGTGQKICPNDNGVLILPPASLDGLQNLSGRGILTHARGCTCEWKGQTKEGQPLPNLGGLTQDCSFSFELPDKPTAACYLMLIVGEQHRLFTISGQGQ